MRDCEFHEFMIERLYAADARRIDEEEEQDEEQEDDDYDWRNNAALTLDEEIKRILP